MKIYLTYILSFLFYIVFSILSANAQSGDISGKIIADNDSISLSDLNVHLLHSKFKTQSDSSGNFVFKDIPFGKYKLEITSDFTVRKIIEISHQSEQTTVENCSVTVKIAELQQVIVEGNKETFGVSRLKSIEGTAIYEGKKNEVIVMKDINANVATNNTRQIYSKVPGINIWESDAAGIQLGIAARGLDPNRTSNFNMRQNGYDMSADALGYPESYYIPPAEAVEKIEVIRGAASLQYGPQFGGMINYVLKKAPSKKKIEFTNNNTIGAYGLFSTFNSIGGTLKRFSYYSFYQYKTGSGWRPNTAFDIHSAFFSLGYKVNSKIGLRLEYTHSNYLNQQPGGLTDAQFERDPKVSLRSRNWFKSNWNILALNFDYKINSKNTINIRNWGFIGDRAALGFLSNISRVDDLSHREMIADSYKNFGSEGRYLRKYVVGKQISSLLVGYRFYSGLTSKKQGRADNGSGPTFSYIDSIKTSSSDFTFPGQNISLFAENIFTLSDKFTVTPGLRFEIVQTNSNGTYYQGSFLIMDTIPKKEARSLKRNFALLGLGLSYYAHKNIEFYFNISQNFRGITFTDMRVISDAYKVDPNLRDENGYNSDLGMRGNIKKWFNYDVSVFLMEYKNRIGFVRERDSAYNIIRYTRNIGASRSTGVESFFEMDLFNIIGKNSTWGNFIIYSSIGYVNAYYTKAYLKDLEGNKMEFAPEWNIRPGVNYRFKKFSTSVQFSYVSLQYTDAKNTELDAATSVSGIVPAYYVADWSVNYAYKFIQAAAGINNITNNIYFTRRASSYPGPGIIPAEPRTFYISLGVKF